MLAVRRWITHQGPQIPQHQLVGKPCTKVRWQVRERRRAAHGLVCITHTLICVNLLPLHVDGMISRPGPGRKRVDGSGKPAPTGAVFDTRQDHAILTAPSTLQQQRLVWLVRAVRALETRWFALGARSIAATNPRRALSQDGHP